MSDRRALMGALLGGDTSDIPWIEFTATVQTNTIPESISQLFANYTRQSNHVYVAVLKSKNITDFANNQAIVIATHGTTTSGAYIRYRNGSYTMGSGANGYDAVIMPGNEFWVAEIDLTGGA